MEEVVLRCDMCDTIIGQGPSETLARYSAQERGNIVEPPCRGDLHLCKSCYNQVKSPRSKII